jgi:hypothetical protein
MITNAFSSPVLHIYPHLYTHICPYDICPYDLRFGHGMNLKYLTIILSFRIEPKVNFAPSKSSSSQALASVLGGGSSRDESPKAPSPKPGLYFSLVFLAPSLMSITASIFDGGFTSASPPPSAWANPFKQQDTSDLPDDPAMNNDGSAPSLKKSGGLFDRISPPKDNGFKVGPSFSSVGDQTWSPDKGFKFAPAPAASTGLFGNTNGSSSSSGLFGSKPASATTTATTSAEASESEGGEPSDAPPPAQKDTDLSLQGPGEEDEDSMFQVRSLVYDMSGGGPPKKLGIGSLRVLKNRNNGKARIIVRSDIGKVVANVALVREVSYSVQDKRCLKVPEFLTGGGIRMLGFRVGKEEVAEQLRKVVEKAKMES